MRQLSLLSQWRPFWRIETSSTPFTFAGSCYRYKNDPEILAMTNLVAAYQRNDILEFEKILKVWTFSVYAFSKVVSMVTTVKMALYQILKGVFLSSEMSLITKKIRECLIWMLCFQSNRKTIMDDTFIRNYIEDLLSKIRTQVLLKLIKPYTRIRIPFISKVHLTFSSPSYLWLWHSTNLHKVLACKPLQPVRWCHSTQVFGRDLCDNSCCELYSGCELYLFALFPSHFV